MGTRAYLSCTMNEELVKGHCFIVPIQHHLSMLEADDDVWDEVRVSSAHTFNLFPKLIYSSLELYEVPHTDGCR